MFRRSLKDLETQLYGIPSPHAINFDEDEDEAMKRIEEEKNEWIWVEGYKGTTKEMKCRGFQFELGKEYTEEGKIVECENGFHLCLKLKDVFSYYELGEKTRYFKVKALVRKKDAEMYGTVDYWSNKVYDKLVAKSIVFISEVETKELYDAIREKVEGLKDAPDRYIEMCINGLGTEAIVEYRKDVLINDGYSEAFAMYMVTHCKNSQYDRAHALASLDGLSMDVKVMMIFK